MRKAAFVLASSFVFFAGLSTAGTSGLDATFGSGGIVRVPPVPIGVGLSFTGIRALRALDDGGFLIGGFAGGNWNPISRAAIGRLLPGGEWDTNFADHGLFLLPADANAAPHGSKIEVVTTFSTGEILAAGVSLQAGSDIYFNTCTLLIKLTAAGVADTSFGPDKSGSFCFDFAPPPADSHRMTLWDDVKVDTDDTFFLTSTSTNLPHNAVAHFDASGALANSYGASGIAALPDGLYGGRLELLPSHNVVVAGVVVDDSGESAGATVVDALGTADSNYGSNGVAALDYQLHPSGISMNRAALDAHGRLLLSSIGISGPTISGYHFERFDAAGAGDSAFNGSNEQPGSPGVAVLSLRSPSDYHDQVSGAIPTPDGHILVVGSVGYSAAGDGTGNIALLRLNEDASYDTTFGQAAHPGWTALNAGGLASSGNSANMQTTDASGRVVVVFSGTDPSGAACNGILRIIPDRLVDASFDPAPPLPTCPQ